jgi:hypothetical protein
MMEKLKGANKHLIFHIGMGKCGSSSIQKYLYKWNKDLSKRSRSVEYLSHPGKSDNLIDLNTVIADYLDYSEWPPYVKEVLEKYPLEISLTDYITRKAQRSRSRFIIVSAEFIAWHLLDESAELFLRTLRSKLPSLKISVVCYFRQPAISRFASMLSEDAKYNSKIKLYISENFFYSENLSTYKRWETLCRKYDIFWKPRIFERNHLVNKDVIDDFLTAVGVDLRRADRLTNPRVYVNRSTDPTVLSSIRRVLGQSFDYLTFGRKAAIIAKLSSIGSRYLAEKNISPTKWLFKPQLENYIAYVSKEEKQLFFENGNIPGNTSIDAKAHPSWPDEMVLAKCLPPGVTFENGYLTGNLECFLREIDESLIDELTRYLKLAILEMASYWSDDKPLSSLEAIRKKMT